MRRHYALRAQHALEGRADGCCAGGGAQAGCCSGDAIEAAPAAAQLAPSWGCGNPTALAALVPGQTVLDLGSGAGYDAFLAARRVAPADGPQGRVIGVDMTDEMLELARSHARQLGLEGVTEFRKGYIEALPAPDASVDVVLSNCVINLSADKAAVFREAYRVLKPGGRLAVSDVVSARELPPSVRQDAQLWAECVAGALSERAYLEAVRAAGFEHIEIHERQTYGRLEGIPMFSLTFSAFKPASQGPTGHS